MLQEWLYVATCMSAYIMGPCHIILNESAMSAVSNPLLSPPASNCCQSPANCPSLSSLSLNFDVHFRFEQIMPFVCFRAFWMEIQRSAQVRVLYVFQRANNFSQHNRSYYVPRWPKCLVPTLAPISGAFSPLMAVHDGQHFDDVRSLFLLLCFPVLCVFKISRPARSYRIRRPAPFALMQALSSMRIETGAGQNTFL